MTTFLQLSEEPIKLELLLQVPQRFFDVPGMDRYLHERPLPPP